nr:lyase family protein [Bacillus licheniformis]
MDTKATRIEKDFLGEKEVPVDAYYGVQTMRAVENFPITGYQIDEELIKALAMVKKAAALANMDIKRLYKELGEVIVKVCRRNSGRALARAFYCRSHSRRRRHFNEYEYE